MLRKAVVSRNRTLRTRIRGNLRTLRVCNLNPIMPPPCSAIPHIREVIAEVEMRRVNAASHIALVEHVGLLRKRTERRRVGNTVSQEVFTLNPNTPIALAMRGPLPQPASAVRLRYYSVKEFVQVHRLLLLYSR